MEHRGATPGWWSNRERHCPPNHHYHGLGGGVDGSGGLMVDARPVVRENHGDYCNNNVNYEYDYENNGGPLSHSRGNSFEGCHGQPLLPRDMVEGCRYGGGGSRGSRGGGGIMSGGSLQHNRGVRGGVLPSHDDDSSSASYQSIIHRHSRISRGEARNGYFGGVVDDRCFEEPDFHSREGYTPSYNRGCNDLDPQERGRRRASDGGGGAGTRFLQHYQEHEEEKMEQARPTVDHVHHFSPIGPAVSVYPKGYLAAITQTKNPPPSSPLSTLGVVTPGRRGFETAEAAKIAAYCEEQGRSCIRGDGSSAAAATTTTTPMVEIFPGVFVRLRGAAETKECIRQDFFMPTICLSCSVEQFCIQDASYVLCPQCRVVNPVFSLEENGSDFGAPPSICGGVGLGFLLEDLGSMQLELMEEERQTQSRTALQETASTSAYSRQY